MNGSRCGWRLLVHLGGLLVPLNVFEQLRVYSRRLPLALCRCSSHIQGLQFDLGLGDKPETTYSTTNAKLTFIHYIHTLKLNLHESLEVCIHLFYATLCTFPVGLWSIEAIPRRQELPTCYALVSMLMVHPKCSALNVATVTHCDFTSLYAGRRAPGHCLEFENNIIDATYGSWKRHRRHLPCSKKSCSKDDRSFFQWPTVVK